MSRSRSGTCARSWPGSALRSSSRRLSLAHHSPSDAWLAPRLSKSSSPHRARVPGISTSPPRPPGTSRGPSGSNASSRSHRWWPCSSWAWRVKPLPASPSTSSCGTAPSSARCDLSTTSAAGSKSGPPRMRTFRKPCDDEGSSPGSRLRSTGSSARKRKPARRSRRQTFAVSRRAGDPASGRWSGRS